MFSNFGSSSETLGRVRAFVEFRSLGRVWAFGQVQRLGIYQSQAEGVCLSMLLRGFHCTLGPFM